jgi:hypothetical protein
MNNEKVWGAPYTLGARYISKNTVIHFMILPSEYVILIAFPLQRWFHERASVLDDTYIACLVSPKSV